METLICFRPTVIRKSSLRLKIKADAPKITGLLFGFYIKAVYDKEYNWTITRTYQEFMDLNTNLRRYLSEGLLPSLPSLPSDVDFKNSNGEVQLKALESYLQELSVLSEICANEVFLEFLEVSVLSFDGSAKKRKEGYVNKRTGGRVGNDQRCFNCSKYCKRLQRRWLIVRDNMVGYLSNHMRGSLHEVLMFKGKFEVLKGQQDTGYPDGIMIATNNRYFYFRAGSEHKMEEWYADIKKAKEESEWKAEDHRYESSFPIRYGNRVRWFVDGIDYFNEVCENLLTAQREVFITDWWLSPELFLKRPSKRFPNSQVLEVLGQIADRGVAVFVHVYKEVSFALTLNSLHTKNTLQNRNQNIKVIRHPHRSIVVGGEFLWSHHEKIVCIDQEIAFIGGLDLCYGRMDTSEHRLVDTVTPYVWNGIDYSNVRIADFEDVQNWHVDSLNRGITPRMPWHDIALRAVGKVAADVALHFIELWNHVMTDITGNYHKDKSLLKPRTNMKTIHETSDEEDKFEADESLEAEPALEPGRSRTSLKVKKLIDQRSSRSLVKRGLSESKRINIEQLEMRIEEDEGESKAILIETMSPSLRRSFGANSSMSSNEGEKSSLIGDASTTFFDRRPSTQAQSFMYRDRKAKLEEEDEKELQKELKRDMDEGDEAWARNLLMPKLKETGGMGSCECQVIRSAGTWSLGLNEPENSIHRAYLHLIDEADHFIYIENQFFISNTAGTPVKNGIAQAIVERIKFAARHKEKFKVIVVLPLLPGFTGAVDDNSASVLRVQLHWLYATISRGNNSIFEQLLRDPNISDPSEYISFYGLRNHAVLGGTPVTEIVYVHSKMMIIDDDTVIIGSANINDRSQVGSHDSEIAMVVCDQDKVQSTLGGSQRMVSKFAFTLRTNIFKEILGISDENLLRDPLSEHFTHTLKSIAKRNTKIYKKVFRCYPDDEIQAFQDIEAFVAQAKLDEYSQHKNEIRGFLVEFPLHFLHNEDLRIKIFNKEYYIPEESFI